MSKQHLADMVKALANGNQEEAKAAFSKFASEKSTEILSRGDEPEEPVTPAVEPTPEPEVPVDTPEVTPAVEPTDEPTT